MKSYEKLLSRKEASEILGVKENTLAVWACTKRYELPYIKVGRLTKYQHKDLIAFMNNNRSDRNE